LATLIFIFIFFRSEKIQNQQILGLAVGGIGVIVVLGFWNGIGSGSGVGVLALFAAITCYGFSYPIIKKYLTPLNLTAEALAASQVTAGAITLLPFYLVDGVASTEYRFGPVLAMMALGILGSGVAYIWNFQIVERAGSSVASSVTYLTPVVAVFIGWIFLNENITWHEPVGGAIVILGAAISQGRFRKKERN
jgi:drug/metabolite transporter (DMT)-like permease